MNTTTVVRFAQTLVFRGWKEFQLYLRHRYLASLSPSQMAGERPKERWQTPFNTVVRHHIETLQAARANVDRDVLARTESISRS